MQRFTLIGATTRTGLLTAPLRARFGSTIRLDFYSAEDLQLIVERRRASLALIDHEDAALAVARRSRGTPRIANRLLRRVRDFAEVRGDGSIDMDMAQSSLKSLEILTTWD